jgi:hypothetical protein
LPTRSVDADQGVGNSGPAILGYQSNSLSIRHYGNLSYSCQAAEIASSAGTGAGCVLQTSCPTDFTWREEWARPIHYKCDNLLPVTHEEAGIEHVPEMSTFINASMPTDQLGGWPTQGTWGSMSSARESDLTETLRQNQYLKRDDTDGILHPLRPAQGPEILSFPNMAESSQYLGNGGDMFFRGEQPPDVSGFVAMRRDYTAQEQREPSFPPPLTGLYPMSDSEPRDSTFGRPAEEPVSPLPAWSLPIPNQTGLDSVPTPQERFSLFDTRSENMGYQESVPVADPNVTLLLPPWLQTLIKYRGDGVSPFDDICKP